jgi:hypothetical protein
VLSADHRTRSIGNPFEVSGLQLPDIVDLIDPPEQLPSGDRRASKSNGFEQIISQRVSVHGQPHIYAAAAAA